MVREFVLGVEVVGKARWKKPCTCGECRDMVSTRPAPALARRSATIRPPIEMRGASFLSDRA